MKLPLSLLALSGIFVILAVLSFDFSIRFYRFFGRDENDRDLVNMVGFVLALGFLLLAIVAFAGSAAIFWLNRQQKLNELRVSLK